MFCLVINAEHVPHIPVEGAEAVVLESHALHTAFTLCGEHRLAYWRTTVGFIEAQLVVGATLCCHYEIVEL